MSTGIWRLFRRGGDDGEGEGKATRAHLGEENQFYYNKELKRWLIRGEEHLAQQQDTPPPPPVTETAGKQLPGNASSIGGIRRLRARDATSLYTATPGLLTKNSGGTEAKKRAPTFVRPPYMLQQQQQQLERGGQEPASVDSSLLGTADEVAPVDTIPSVGDKEGCRVRAALSAPPLSDSPRRASAEEGWQGQQQEQSHLHQQTAVVERSCSETNETSERPQLFLNASAQCSTGSPSPPENETRLLPTYSSLQQLQQQRQQHGQDHPHSLNGLGQASSEPERHSYSISQQQQHLVQAEHQEQVRLIGEEGEPLGAQGPSHHQYYAISENHEAHRPLLDYTDAAEALKVVDKAASEHGQQQQEGEGNAREDATFGGQFASTVQRQNPEDMALFSDEATKAHDNEVQESPLPECMQQWQEQREQNCQRQHQPHEGHCADRQLQNGGHLGLPERGCSSGSNRSRGTAPEYEGDLNDEVNTTELLPDKGGLTFTPKDEAATAVGAATATANTVAADAGEEHRFCSATLSDKCEASDSADSLHPSAKTWDSCLPPTTSLQQEGQMERLQQEGHQRQSSQQLQQLNDENHQQKLQHHDRLHHQLLHQGVSMEDILPGFARAVQELERSSAETLRQLATLQQQVSNLRSRNTSLTKRIQRVIEQLLSGEGPMVERQRAAELVQDAIFGASEEFPSPMGEDAEPQPSPACSAISDAEAALEEAQGAVSALTQMLVEQMERNRQLQEEDMHFDADMVHFIAQLQQQHGSLEPLLQQQLLLQEAHIEQQEKLDSLKCMHDDLSRRMEESCARAADLEGQLVLALEKKQQVQRQLDDMHENLQRQQELFEKVQQQKEHEAGELRQQADFWQQQLSDSQQQWKDLQKSTQQQKELLEVLQERLDAAAGRERVATVARVAAEAARKVAEGQAAKAMHAKEQLQQELQQHEQRQREETRALLEEKEEALNESLNAQKLQHDLVQQMRRQQEVLEGQLLTRELMMEQLQTEINQLLLKLRQEQEHQKAEMKRLEEQHVAELQGVAAEYAGILKEEKEQLHKLAEEKQRLMAAYHEEVERSQQKVDALQQQLAQQEEQNELMAQRQQEDTEHFLRRLQQQEVEGKEKQKQLQKQAEEKRMLLEQSDMQKEELSRQVEDLKSCLQGAESRVQMLQKDMDSAATSFEVERNALQQQLKDAMASVQQQLEQHEATRKKHQCLQQEYDAVNRQMSIERSELEQRVVLLEAQLHTQQGLLQAAREELLQQPVLLQQKHEEDLQQQLGAMRQLELEERERLQQERDQILEQQQEKHALLMQQLREQHALEQQQLQQRMQQEQQEQQETLRSHFEQLWDEESAKIVAANAAVVEKLQQAQQMLLEKQRQLEAYEIERDALAVEQKESVALQAQLLATKSDAQRLQQRCKTLELQVEELRQQRSCPEAEVQAIMEEELHQLRERLVEKERLSQLLQHQLDEHVASQRDRLGEVNAMLERQEEASKQKDLRLRSVEEELQALQQLLQDTVDVKQLEAARAEAAEGNRKVQRLENDLAAAMTEQESLRKALQAAEKQLNEVRSGAEADAAANALNRLVETKEAGTQAMGEDTSQNAPDKWETLERQSKRAQLRNEELTLRNATLTRISDFLSRRLQFFERALADMGPHGLVVIEDCDRSVVLSPAEIDFTPTESSVPELISLREDAGPSEEQAPLNSSGKISSADGPTISSSHRSTVERGSPASNVKVNEPTSSVSWRERGADKEITLDSAPPKPPEFLRELKAPKALG